jgi:hypothetical protein
MRGRYWTGRNVVSTRRDSMPGRVVASFGRDGSSTFPVLGVQRFPFNVQRTTYSGQRSACREKKNAIDWRVNDRFRKMNRPHVLLPRPSPPCTTLEPEFSILHPQSSTHNPQFVIYSSGTPGPSGRLNRIQRTSTIVLTMPNAIEYGSMSAMIDPMPLTLS